MAIPSTSQVVRQSHQLWSRVPLPTNAFTQFAQDQSAVDKGPHQRHEADSAAVHRRRYSDCAFPQRGAHQRGEHERRISSKMSLAGSAPDVQGKRSSSPALPRAATMVEADRSCSIHTPRSPPPREDHQQAPGPEPSGSSVTANAKAAEAATVVCDVSSGPSIAGPSMRQEVQHYHQLWSGIPPPPNAFMPFAQEKRRLVAAEKLNENNQRVSSRLGKMRHSLSSSDKQAYQRKAAEAGAVHRRRYPDYVFDQGRAHQRKEQECMRGSSTKGESSRSPEVPCPFFRVEVGSLEFQQPSAAIITAAEKQSSCNLGCPWAYIGRSTGHAVSLANDHRIAGSVARPCHVHPCLA
ncbi:hypothetical protein HPB52_014122 [Rhipicephalus sanguineus]|uniref:Sex-determining region Y protein n=1 Tax=Rhipicephalus sanguineus TaxID=34632 RepID=A0A9D4TAG0_RHISA|nr:hypothetical protein HPB52_014122 [Rhipicephalus sanguineus]